MPTTTLAPSAGQSRIVSSVVHQINYPARRPRARRLLEPDGLTSEQRETIQALNPDSLPVPCPPEDCNRYYEDKVRRKLLKRAADPTLALTDEQRALVVQHADLIGRARTTAIKVLCKHGVALDRGLLTELQGAGEQALAESARTFDPTRRSFGAYAGKAIKNAVGRALRKTLKRWSLISLTLNAPVAENGTDGLPEQDETWVQRITDVASVHAYEYLQGSNRRHAATMTLLATLPDRERQVLTLRYGVGQDRPHTLAETGRELRLSPTRVSQIEIKAIQRLGAPVHRRLLREVLHGNVAATDSSATASAKKAQSSLDEIRACLSLARLAADAGDRREARRQLRRAKYMVQALWTRTWTGSEFDERDLIGVGDWQDAYYEQLDGQPRSGKEPV